MHIAPEKLHHCKGLAAFAFSPQHRSPVASISEELRTEFPKLTWFAAGGDVEVSWKVSVRVRPDGAAEELRQSLARWASKNEPLVRKYSVRQRSLWRTA